jgi:uncharacterized protein YajQ (UPF0234 family)
MAKEHSLDISAEINKQELKNAIEQAKKEITNRYDFKGLVAKIEYNEKNKIITLLASSDNKADAMKDILISKIIKREIPAKALKEQKRENSSGGNIKVYIDIIDSISSEDAKNIVKEIKALKLKVQASIRGDIVRVIAKSIDDLQVCMQAVKEKDIDIPLNFINMK